MELGRLLTAMVTPMRRDGAVDYGQARRLARALVDSGSDGVVVCGTTGEAPTLRPEEKLRLWSEVKDELRGTDAAVIAGSGDNCTADSIELSCEAARTGVDALLLTAPYYNRPTQEGMYRHFAAIAEAVDLPQICYNIPSRTGVNMGADLQLRLSRVGNIAGVKEASGDMKQIAHVIDDTRVNDDARPGFRVWAGNDEDAFPIVAMGGWGVISVASHLVGRQLAGMLRDAAEGRTAEAAAMHRRLLPLVDALFCVTNPIPVKHALNLLGFDVGPLRLPLCEPDDDSAERIAAELRRHTIDLPLPV
jgi:4-hydroxy-tetrahydrodipicolinate synthase